MENLPMTNRDFSHVDDFPTDEPEYENYFGGNSKKNDLSNIKLHNGVDYFEDVVPEGQVIPAYRETAKPTDSVGEKAEDPIVEIEEYEDDEKEDENSEMNQSFEFDGGFNSLESIVKSNNQNQRPARSKDESHNIETPENNHDEELIKPEIEDIDPTASSTNVSCHELSKHCKNGSTCSVNEDGAFCLCANGFSGELCEIDEQDYDNYRVNFLLPDASFSFSMDHFDTKSFILFLLLKITSV